MSDHPPRRPTLFVVAVSHLDSQWRWTLRESVSRFLPHTVEACRAAFARFSSHVLSFEGAHRYALLREHHPEAWESLKEAVAAGRWAPAGAAWEAMDCVIPSSESLIRQVLHGQRFFERELGRRCHDLFLPDCFGFPAALPTIARHCGLVGFSTQKLRLREQLRAARPIPFHFGLWQGPDGSELLAALDPGGYGEPVASDLSTDPFWEARLGELVRAGIPPIGYLYTGIGDKGGALPEASLAWLETSARSAGTIRVVPCSSERPYLEVTDEERARLPRHRGELLLAVHATGGYSSQAAIKKGNRDCERLADLAERAAALAVTVSGEDVSRESLGESWRRFLAHQMHDTLCGTCIPEANAIAWNDQLLARTRFAQALSHGAAAVASRLDTRVAGLPVVVFNPHSRAVEEVVAVGLPTPLAPGQAWCVRAPSGTLHPVQLVAARGSRPQALFLARLEPLSFSVYSLETGREEQPELPESPELAAGERSLSSRFLEATLDENGDLVSLRDLRAARELLGAPFRFELLRDLSERFPAWEVMHADISAPPTGCFGPPARIEVVESGPVRVALSVDRRHGRSRLRQLLRLGGGECGRRLEMEIELDWWSRGRLLKARLEVAGSVRRAVFDGGVGEVERGVSTPQLYEAPAQSWARLEGERGAVAVLSPFAMGWDRPSESTLRLTLVRSPRIGHRFRYQRDQDLGAHRTRLALLTLPAADSGPAVVEQASRFRQAPIAFPVTHHAGPLGRVASLAALEGDGLWIDAVKRREEGDGLVFRIRETRGAGGGARLRLARPVREAEELDGCERPLRRLACAGEVVDLPLSSWGLATVGVRVAAESATVSGDEVPLAFDRPISSRDGQAGGPGFDGRGVHFPTELVPEHLDCDGVRFSLGRDAENRLLAARSNGQIVEVDGRRGDLYLLGASSRADGHCPMRVDGALVELPVFRWRGPIGQWDRVGRPWPLLLPRLRRAFFRPAHVAWVATHLHDRRGRNLVVELGLLFRHHVRLPERPCRVELPRAPGLLLVAAALAPRWLAEGPSPVRLVE